MGYKTADSDVVKGPAATLANPAASAIPEGVRKSQFLPGD
jgi:hypothetical protein